MTKHTYDRRNFLVVMSATVFLLGFASLPAACAADSQRNVLFIGIDDLNDWIGCLGGNPDVKTPHIDRLAARGVLFTIAHCAAPACNPSRAALMTGIRPSTSGVYHNPQPWRTSCRATASCASAESRSCGGSRSRI